MKCTVAEHVLFLLAALTHQAISQNDPLKSLREAAENNEDDKHEVSGNFFSKSFLRMDVCHSNSDNEYVTENLFFLRAYLRILFTDDVAGSCSDLCADLCDADQCHGLSIDEEIKTCVCQGYSMCDTNAFCDSSSVCQCNDGFDGNGLVCCDLSAGQAFSESRGSCSSTRVSVTECDGDGACKWDDTNINLEASVLDFTLTEQGPKYSCTREIADGDGWIGECDGGALEVTLAKHSDINGTDHIFGSITVPDDVSFGTYKVCDFHPDLNGVGTVNCQPLSNFEDEDDVDDDYDVDSLQSPPRQLTGPFDDKGWNIDVMVVWTKAAECEFAGLSRNCVLTSNTEYLMNGLVKSAVLQASGAFRSSGIAQDGSLSFVRLVYAYRDDDYDESKISGDLMETVRGHLMDQSDGQLDKVHWLRDKYRADLVAMIVRKGGSGISDTEVKKEKAFSVSSWDYTTNKKTFAHEIGHNFHLLHDRGNSHSKNQCGTTWGSNFAYRDPQARFRSVMAYDCTENTCGTDVSATCPRLLKFSSDSKQHNYKGTLVPFGLSTENNAGTLDTNKAIVAGYYKAHNCESDSECDDGRSYTDDSCDKLRGTCIFEINPASFAPTCKVGEVAFQLALMTDSGRGYQVSWSLVDECSPTRNEVKKVGTSTYTGSTYYNESICVSAQGKYTFTIKDSVGDGICCDNGYGEYAVFVDGRKIIAGGEYGTSMSTTFGACKSDPCKPNPCLNGGTCGGTSSKFTCFCPQGFSGDVCEKVWPSCKSADGGLSGYCEALLGNDSCELHLPSNDCKTEGESCCITEYLSCSFENPISGIESFGNCFSSDSCPSTSVFLPGGCPGNLPSSVGCCMGSDETNDLCTASGKYTGHCIDEESCLSNDLVPMEPDTADPKLSCSSDKACCIGPLSCESKGSNTVSGICTNETRCVLDEKQPVLGPTEVCNGDPSIHCCLDLKNYECKKDNVRGSCMDKDRCSGSRQKLVPYNFADQSCPGSSEVQCCIDLPECAFEANGITYPGNCLKSSEECIQDFGGLAIAGSNYCPGGDDMGVVCCVGQVPCEVYDEDEFLQNKGHCIHTSLCDQTDFDIVPGLCPIGATNQECCVPKPVACDVWEQDTLLASGVCEPTSVCGNRKNHYIIEGWCTEGIPDFECCIPKDETLPTLLPSTPPVTTVPPSTPQVTTMPPPTPPVTHSSCSLDDPGVQCCTTADCPHLLIQTCSFNMCILSGIQLRFSLSWTGDDQLSLQISHFPPEVTGLAFNSAFEPIENPYNNTRWGHYVKNRFVSWHEDGEFDGSGNYTFYVWNYDFSNVTDNEGDHWQLGIFANDILIAPIFSGSPVPKNGYSPSASFIYAGTGTAPHSFNYDGLPCGTGDTVPFDINRDPVNLEYPAYIALPNESDRCYLRLTGDSSTPAAASAFTSLAFDEDNDDYIFSMSASYRAFGSTAGSADGIAFVIHQDTRGTSALGGQGGNIGIYDSNIISPALVIELDTYTNFDHRLDEGENHIHVIRVHENSTLEELHETATGLPIRTDDAGVASGRLWISYCDDGKLRVYVNNNGNNKPAEPQVAINIDMKQIFTGSEVFIGFTSGTYLEGDNHDILSFSFQQNCSVTNPWTPFGNDVNGIYNYGYFGGDVALSDDGLVLAVGGDNVNGTGMVQVFEYSDQQWHQRGQNLTGLGDDDFFGDSIALSGHGMVLAVGAWEFGNDHADTGRPSGGYAQVFVYHPNSDEWHQVGDTFNGTDPNDWYPNNRYGYSVALSQDGWTVAFGDTEDGGRVQVFEYITAIQDWAPLGKDIKDGCEADRLSFSADGRTLAVGSRDYPSTGFVRVYKYDSSEDEWKRHGSDIPDTLPYQDAYKVALSGDGSRLVIGSEWISYSTDPYTYNGRMRVYDFDGSDWQLKGDPVDVYGVPFGRDAAISRDGQRVASGGFTFEEGYAQVYSWDAFEGQWSQLGLNLESEYFSSVALSQNGTVLAVGSSQSRAPGNYNPRGQVKVYRYGEGV